MTACCRILQWNQTHNTPRAEMTLTLLFCSKALRKRLVSLKTREKCCLGLNLESLAVCTCVANCLSVTMSKQSVMLHFCIVIIKRECVWNQMEQATDPTVNYNLWLKAQLYSWWGIFCWSVRDSFGPLFSFLKVELLVNWLAVQKLKRSFKTSINLNYGYFVFNVLLLF